MKGFFDGIGQWAATFGCQDVRAGQVVKFVQDGQVAGCEDGEPFCGCVISVGRDGSACSVALGGIVSASFSGSAPAVGWNRLAADGKGGVRIAGDAANGSGVSGGGYCRVIDADPVQESVTFVL